MHEIFNKKLCCLIIFLFVNLSMAQQIAINRIEQMPNQPSPYELRDWGKVTLGYDSLVFDFFKEGEYLPLIWWNSNTINYPNHQTFGLHTVVGTTAPFSSEAINVLPAVIGASLNGIDKSSQNGHNWVLYCEEFYNKRPEENVYLNHPVAESGDDWWYATMPNIFFYQLYNLYPQTGDFAYQFTSVANQWLQAVRTMGGSASPWQKPDMDHRGWYLSTMTPYDEGVHQPEAAGAIGWLLYNAFHETGAEKYRIAAEWAMEFLNEWPSNPSYELQLPYGVYIAARMNAELGTEYDVQKMLNWCFDVGPLRQWGAILGRWGIYDVYGLIGEAEGSNDYAFVMNTFEQIGALVPLVRYDDRFARAIGKWVLNAANALRLFYPDYLSDLNQDSEEWAHAHDPNSYIAHEAMRQMANGFPYATGDAIDGGWGATNLVLYGSSHVGIVGAIIKTTNVEKILQLDLLKTDYFHEPAYPSYLYFNPYDEVKEMQVDVGAANHDLYNAVSNDFIAYDASGITTVSIPADQAILLVVIPSGGTITYQLDKMLVNDIVVDYMAGQSVSNYPPRIKSLAGVLEKIAVNDSTRIYCTAMDKDHSSLNYTWWSSGGIITGGGSSISWQAPANSGNYLVSCTVQDEHGSTDSTSITIQAVEYINIPPIIDDLGASQRKIDLNASTSILCSAHDPDDDQLTFTWQAVAGTIDGQDSMITWTAPAFEGNYFIKCIVSDGWGGQVADSVGIVVRDFSIIPSGELVAYFPFNGNAQDECGYGHHGTVYGATLVADRFSIPEQAYSFDGQNDYILVPNSSTLNFQDAITVNFWLKVTQFYDTREAYPISHGNWERRWKFSVTNRRIRWTIKTTTQIKDLDSEILLEPNRYYNITGSYNGADFELYINGELDNFSSLTGSILTTNIDLTIGQVLPDTNQYNFKGIIDDVRIFDYALSVQEIAELYDLASKVKNSISERLPETNFLQQNYPNPFNEGTLIRYQISATGYVEIHIFDMLGRRVNTLVNNNQPAGYYTIDWKGNNERGESVTSGIYICEMRTKNFSQWRKLLIIR